MHAGEGAHDLIGVLIQTLGHLEGLGDVIAVSYTHLDVYKRQGTDSATRSPKALLAKTKALNEEGLTAYCLTGAYDIPSPTVTGSLKDDVTYLSEVLGVKVALSDHRGGHPTLEQFIHMACQVRLGALTAGKPGVVHIHMGSGKRGLGLVYDLSLIHI